MALKGSVENAKARLLLVLWGEDGLNQSILRGKVSLVRTKERASDYDEVFAALEGDGAIALTRKKNGAIQKVALTESGYGLLGDFLRSPDFRFDGTQIGAKMGNYLLKWIAGVPNVAVVAESAPKIASYDEFKAVALETYDQLNRDYNFDNLVPIYRIRRAIGERVTRSQFSDWLLEMQSNEIVQLQGGGVEDDAPDKLEDSILTKVSGLRCYAKKLAS